MSKTTPTRPRPAKRRALGAVMMETVFILPFIMVVVVLIIYLGWNFRRMAQVTNMDRYAVWEETTPGSPGPDTQHRIGQMRNPRLNNAFYGLSNDQAIKLDEHQNRRWYYPQGHEDLRDRQVNETYSYFDEFLENNPRARYERFDAKHEQISDALTNMGMSDLTRNDVGHSRMDGDWRYVNGVVYDSRTGKWKPGRRRVTPGSSLREVFFVDLDDGLEPYDSSGNKLAKAIREFYLSYPGYRGPDIANDSRGGAGWDPFGGGPADGF